MCINEPWIIDRALSNNEKLLLYLSAKSIGIRVSEQFMFIDDMYPLTTYTESNVICGRKKGYSHNRQLVKYEEVMRILQEKIKENEYIW